jgi:hypothetical protein
MSAAGEPEPPLPELLASLRRESLGLALSELELLKAEVRARAKDVSAGLVPAALGLIAVQTAFLALCATAIVALGRAWGGRYELAALSVSSFFLLISVVAFLIARRRFARALRDDGQMPGQALIEVLHGRPH